MHRMVALIQPYFDVCYMEHNNFKEQNIDEGLRISLRNTGLFHGDISSRYLVIPSHGNPQMRRTLFGGYLFKYWSVK